MNKSEEKDNVSGIQRDVKSMNTDNEEDIYKVIEELDERSREEKEASKEANKKEWKDFINKNKAERSRDFVSGRRTRNMSYFGDDKDKMVSFSELWHEMIELTLIDAIGEYENYNFGSGGWSIDEKAIKKYLRDKVRVSIIITTSVKKSVYELDNVK